MNFFKFLKTKKYDEYERLFINDDYDNFEQFFKLKQKIRWRTKPRHICKSKFYNLKK